jgi:hypothetical protein
VSAKQAYDDLAGAMEPVFSALAQIGTTHKAAIVDQMLDATLGHPFLEETGRPLILSRWQTFQYAEVLDGLEGVRLAAACAVALQDDRTVLCAVGILVYGIPPTLGGGGFTWNDRAVASVGSLTVGQEIQRLAREARSQMPAAIASFTELAANL